MEAEGKKCNACHSSADSDVCDVWIGVTYICATGARRACRVSHENIKEVYNARLQSGPQLLWEIITLLVDETDFVVRVGANYDPLTQLMLAGTIFHRFCGAHSELHGPEENTRL